MEKSKKITSIAIISILILLIGYSIRLDINRWRELKELQKEKLKLEIESKKLQIELLKGTPKQ